MRGLTAEEVLAAGEKPGSWTREKPGFSEKPGFFGGEKPGFLSGSVGRVDAALLELRAATFGPIMPCVTDCPACGEALEFDAPAAELIALADEEQAAYRWAGLGAEVEHRLPRYADLAALTGLSDPQAAATALLRRVVTAATYQGQPVDASALPAEVVDALAADMAQHDPQAETLLALVCPACGHAWSAALDIGDFFHRELKAEARRLIGEVHVLARAYGWSEAAILALPPARRRAYLDLLGAGSGAGLR